jgi:hypothetical protein
VFVLHRTLRFFAYYISNLIVIHEYDKYKE